MRIDTDLKQALEGQIVALNAIKEALVLSQKPSYSDDIGARVAELEIKMGKLWGLLLETTPSGQDKLNRFAKKRFGGRSKLYEDGKP